MTLTACGNSDNKSAAPNMTMPPPAVTVATLNPRVIDSWEVFTGRLESEASVDVRSRVSGYIESVALKEGSLVKEGDLLFTIDDRELKIEVKRLEAQLVSAQAQIDLAIRNLDRAKSLKETNSISQSQLEINNTQLIKAKSDFDNIEAQLENAKLSLSFTQVTAPISGQVSNAIVTEGNYVSAGQQILTTLVSLENIHAYFDVDERTFSEFTSLREQVASGRVVVAEMQMLGEDGFPHNGKIDFVDNKMDPNTGAIRLRAEFKNTQYALLPGMFARIRIKVKESATALLIDERAISTDLSHKYVLVVGENNVVEYRPVTLGKKIGVERIVESGLQAGDVFILDGVQRARPGLPVSPKAPEVDQTNSSDQG